MADISDIKHNIFMYEITKAASKSGIKSGLNFEEVVPLSAAWG